MKIPDIVQTTRDTLRHLALAAAVGASFLAGTAQAATITWGTATDDTLNSDLTAFLDSDDHHNR